VDVAIVALLPSADEAITTDRRRTIRVTAVPIHRVTIIANLTRVEMTVTAWQNRLTVIQDTKRRAKIKCSAFLDLNYGIEGAASRQLLAHPIP